MVLAHECFRTCPLLVCSVSLIMMGTRGLVAQKPHERLGDSEFAAGPSPGPQLPFRASPRPPAVLRHVLLHTESSVAEGPRRAVPATQAGFHSPPEHSGQQGDTWPPSQALGFHHPALVQSPVTPALPGRRAPAPTLPLLVLSACLDSDLEMSPNVPRDGSSLI